MKRRGASACSTVPGRIVRVGVAGRFERTHTPKAVVNPVDGTFRSNDTDG